MVGIANEKRVSALPIRLGIKRKMFSGGDEVESDLFAVLLMALTSTEPSALFNTRLAFVAIALIPGTRLCPAECV